MVGETEGDGGGTNIPDGLIRPGLELTLTAGTPGIVPDDMTGMEEDDCVGRLAAELVGFTKTVEVMVIVTGPLAPESVACGILRMRLNSGHCPE